MSEWLTLDEIPEDVTRVRGTDLNGTLTEYVLIRDPNVRTGWLVDWNDGEIDTWYIGDGRAPYVPDCVEDSEQDDPVSPSHYQGFSNGAQVIDITENLTSNGGQAVQYIARSTRLDGRNKGNPVEDLRKAQFFIAREIERLTESVN